MSRREELLCCPFVEAVADDKLDRARQLANAGSDPAGPVVTEWLIAEARRHLEEAGP